MSCVVAVVLILALIALIVVLLARWHRQKRHRARQRQMASAEAVDDTFDPYVVDDAATDKLSCSGQALENGLCHVSDGSASPRHLASPKRPVSYTLSMMTGPGGNVENMMRTHDYGSNADELENAGRHPDSSQNPEFVGRSPVVMAKRFPGPTSVNSETSKGLNNLNKAENYRKKSTYMYLISR